MVLSNCDLSIDQNTCDCRIVISTILNEFLEVLKDEEFLEAVTSALRSLLQIMATKNIPQVITTFIIFML